MSDKSQRVANFHRSTVENVGELLAAAGLDSLDQLKPDHIMRRVQGTNIQSYAELYPCIDAGCLVNADSIPEGWKNDWESSQADRW